MQLKSGMKTQGYLSHLYCTHCARQYEMREGCVENSVGRYQEEAVNGLKRQNHKGR